MNTQPINQAKSQENIELRIRTMRTLWIAMLSSIGGYYVLTVFTRPSADVIHNHVFSLVLVGLALLTTLISFPIKNKLLNLAVHQQQVQLVQQGYIVAWAIADIAALLGILDYFFNANSYYFIYSVIAAGGMLLHFPRREPVINAAATTSKSNIG